MLVENVGAIYPPKFQMTGFIENEGQYGQPKLKTSVTFEIIIRGSQTL